MPRLLTERVMVQLSVEQREALEQIAEREYRSVAAVVRNAVREYLAREHKREEAAA